MAGAGELVRRARASRRSAQQPVRQERAASPRPEAWARAPEASAPRQEQAARLEFEERPPERTRRPELTAHHEAYSALMRSHDRMRTQHLPVQGGGNRA